MLRQLRHDIDQPLHRGPLCRAQKDRRAGLMFGLKLFNQRLRVAEKAVQVQLIRSRSDHQRHFGQASRPRLPRQVLGPKHSEMRGQHKEHQQQEHHINHRRQAGPFARRGWCEIKHSPPPCPLG